MANKKTIKIQDPGMVKMNYDYPEGLPRVGQPMPTSAEISIDACQAKSLIHAIWAEFGDDSLDDVMTTRAQARPAPDLTPTGDQEVVEPAPVKRRGRPRKKVEGA